MENRYFEYNIKNNAKTTLIKCIQLAKSRLNYYSKKEITLNKIDQSNTDTLYSLITSSKTNNNILSLGNVTDNKSAFINYFNSTELSTLFCMYINSNLELLKQNDSSYKLFDIYKMAKTLL